MLSSAFAEGRTTEQEKIGVTYAGPTGIRNISLTRQEYDNLLKDSTTIMKRIWTADEEEENYNFKEENPLMTTVRLEILEDDVRGYTLDGRKFTERDYMAPEDTMIPDAFPKLVDLQTGTNYDLTNLFLSNPNNSVRMGPGYEFDIPVGLPVTPGMPPVIPEVEIRAVSSKGDQINCELKNRGCKEVVVKIPGIKDKIPVAPRSEIPLKRQSIIELGPAPYRFRYE